MSAFYQLRTLSELTIGGYILDAQVIKECYRFSMNLKIVSVAGLALCAGSPVWATSSIFCRIPEQPEVELSLSIGHPPMAIGGASFNDGSGALNTGADLSQIVIAQSWLDEEELKLDLADENVENLVVQLRARRVREGVYAGTMRHRERTLEVDCRLDEEEEE